jgi:hypothetical protein
MSHESHWRIHVIRPDTDECVAFNGSHALRWPSAGVAPWADCVDYCRRAEAAEYHLSIMKALRRGQRHEQM